MDGGRRTFFARSSFDYGARDGRLPYGDDTHFPDKNFGDFAG